MSSDEIEAEFDSIVAYHRNKPCQQYGHLYRITDVACVLCGEPGDA